MFGPDADDEGVGGIFTEGVTLVMPRSTRWQRAAPWREIARELPAGPNRDAALEREGIIAGLLDYDPPNPYRPTAPIERRFATQYVNALQDVRPRIVDYYGPVTVRKGKLVPRRQDSDDSDAKHVVDARFDAALDRGEPLEA
jgi:hypothetical protein